MFPGGFHEIVESFPAVNHAFAYGSGVISQTGSSEQVERSQLVLDFIFAVSDPVLWHEKVRFILICVCLLNLQLPKYTCKITLHLILISMCESRRTSVGIGGITPAWQPLDLPL